MNNKTEIKTNEEYYIIRTENAGVFFAKIKEYDKNTRSAILQDCRRIWYWSGAASLSQLAVDGTSDPNECKFPIPTQNHEVNQIIEKIKCTEKAINSIKGVKIWEE